MILRHVLYVPQLTCNLISVSKLISDNNCLITFIDKLCVIQDRTSRTMTGVGEECDGVYYFKSVVPTQANATRKVEDFDL